MKSLNRFSRKLISFTNILPNLGINTITEYGKGKGITGQERDVKTSIKNLFEIWGTFSICKYIAVKLYLSIQHSDMHDEGFRSFSEDDEINQCDDCLEFFFKRYGWEYNEPDSLTPNEVVLFQQEKKEHMSKLRNDVRVFKINFPIV